MHNGESEMLCAWSACFTVSPLLAPHYTQTSALIGCTTHVKDIASINLYFP